MDKKKAYFVKRIEYSLREEDYEEAKYYYDKAINCLGRVQEITTFEKQINEAVKKVKPKSIPLDPAKATKRKPINAYWIVIPVVLIGIIVFGSYYFSEIYPVKHLGERLYLETEWYQGDKEGRSDTAWATMKFTDRTDDTLQVQYRTGKAMPIEFELQIISGDEITVNGRTIQVEFEDDYVIFSPSIVGVSDQAVWRSEYDWKEGDKTGNFSSEN